MICMVYQNEHVLDVLGSNQNRYHSQDVCYGIFESSTHDQELHTPKQGETMLFQDFTISLLCVSQRPRSFP